jgi:hypothetical protein
VPTTSEQDLELLARSRSIRRFASAEVVPDAAGPTSDEVYLLTRGGAALEAETPLGPFAVATFQAPALLNLARALDTAPDLVRLVFEPGAESAVFGAGEARGLLFDPGPEGQAFRRLALASVAVGVRETNAAIARFFDGFASASAKKRESGEFPSPFLKTDPVDPARVYDLFDAAGLNPQGLPDLGLISRSIAGERSLVRAGAPAEEAYLLAEGRLRVSIFIPGVGEEALAILGPGEIVGEMALIDDAPRSADVKAHEGPALVYALSRAVFRNLLDSGDPAGAPLLAGIAVALTRRHEEAVRKAATFRVLAGPF